MRSKVEEDIRKICDDASAEYGDISFEVKKEKHIYIKVSISNGEYLPPSEVQVEEGDDKNQTTPLLSDAESTKKNEEDDNV